LRFIHGRGEFKILLRYENAGNFMDQRKRRSPAPLSIDVRKPALRMIVGRFDKEVYKSINREK
jgi:hypothetical protein